jgi:hypothetical protein
MFGPFRIPQYDCGRPHCFRKVSKERKPARAPCGDAFRITLAHVDLLRASRLTLADSESCTK